MKLTELELINELNSRLASVQSEVNQDIRESSAPTTYILGCPRSGTTALLQYLALTGTWAYPTNVLTRFSQSVYIGSLVQEILFNDSYGLIKPNNSIDFKSEYGRSAGPLNANEFFHFFRRFFPSNEIGHLTDEQLTKVDTTSLLSEIASITKVQKKPFLAKGLMFQYNLAHFQKYLPNSIFLYIKRKDEFVMQSIYKARLKEFSDINKWWSAKPKEYSYLLTKSAEEQIAGQVYYTNLAIENGLKKVPLENKLVITYEDFIANPEKTCEDLVSKYEALGFPLTNSSIDQTQSLFNANRITIEPKIMSKMLNYMNKFKHIS